MTLRDQLTQSLDAEHDPALVEACAKAAYVEFCMGKSDPWWDDDEAELYDPAHQWPDNVGTHIGVEGFRRCARAALTAQAIYMREQVEL